MKTPTDDLIMLRLELRIAFRVHANRKFTLPGFLSLAIALAKAIFVP